MQSCTHFFPFSRNHARRSIHAITQYFYNFHAMTQQKRPITQSRIPMGGPLLPCPQPPICRFYPTSYLPPRLSSSISHLPRISLPIPPPKSSLSPSAYPNIPCLHLLLTDINIRDRTRYFWMFMFMVSDRNISQSVSSSSIYIGEVSISLTEYFQFVHQFDGRIETMKWAKNFIVWCVFPVFILSDRIMFQMI